MDYTHRAELHNSYDYPPVGGHAEESQSYADLLEQIRQQQKQINTMAAEIVRLRGAITALETEGVHPQRTLYSPGEQGHGPYRKVTTW